MTTWTRARWTQQCGLCAAVIREGDPLLVVVIQFKGKTHRKLRCARCEGPPPPDLPTEVAPALAPIALERLTRLGAVVPVDFKARSAGDREPGEEG